MRYQLREKKKPKRAQRWPDLISPLFLSHSLEKRHLPRLLRQVGPGHPARPSPRERSDLESVSQEERHRVGTPTQRIVSASDQESGGTSVANHAKLIRRLTRHDPPKDRITKQDSEA
jgi:hypothetical protein